MFVVKQKTEYELLRSLVGTEMCIRERKRNFFFQAEDGIRVLVRSRGLGDVYKRRLLRFHLGFTVV